MTAGAGTGTDAGTGRTPGAGAAAEAGATDPIVEMRGITKRFGRIEALTDVDLTVHEGTVLGLLGDNGAGKSTLIKILVGLHDPTGGTIRVRGEQVAFDSPRDAKRHGIETVYQDLALVDERSVAENVFLGRYPKKSLLGPLSIVDYDRMRSEADRLLSERLDLQLDPTARVEFLSGGERQAVAIARALVTDPDIVILDEPTSALSADAAERVRSLIGTLREEGITVVMISHDLNEVFGVTDRLVVLHNGRRVGAVDADAASKNDIVRMMVDGSVPEHLRESSADVVG
jgi:ABC-type sugar transport system ATPase subunit